MENSLNDRPAFLGDNWLRPEQGYSYALAPPVDLMNERNLDSEDEWMKFLYIFEKAKVNDRTHLHLLPALIRQSRNPYLCGAALDLIGAAGSEDLLEALIPFMSNSVFDIRLDAYAASTMSYRLMFIEPLLEARTRHLSTERGMIENSLSDMLEREASIICEPIGLSNTEYEKFVRDTAREVEAMAGIDVPVFGGETLDLRNIITEIKMLTQDPDIQEYAGILMGYLHRFEAITGFPCKSLFDEEGNPLSLSIRAIIETFEQEGFLSKFRPGQRYFFGHLLT